MASALMIPAFSPRSSRRRPQVLGVVQVDRRDDGDPRVGHVGGVPRAAHADLDDGDVDRRVGEQRVRHADHDLEEGHRDVAAGVDHLHVGRDVVVGLDEPLGAHRLAVEDDPLPDRLQVRLVNRPTRSPKPRSSSSIIRAVVVLPLVPATWTTGIARCGEPSRSTSALMRVSDGSSRLSGQRASSALSSTRAMSPVLLLLILVRMPAETLDRLRAPVAPRSMLPAVVSRPGS